MHGRRRMMSDHRVHSRIGICIAAGILSSVLGCVGPESGANTLEHAEGVKVTVDARNFPILRVGLTNPGNYRQLVWDPRLSVGKTSMEVLITDSLGREHVIRRVRRVPWNGESDLMSIPGGRWYVLSVDLADGSWDTPAYLDLSRLKGNLLVHVKRLDASVPDYRTRLDIEHSEYVPFGDPAISKAPLALSVDTSKFPVITVRVTNISSCPATIIAACHSLRGISTVYLRGPEGQDYRFDWGSLEFGGTRPPRCGRHVLPGESFPVELDLKGLGCVPLSGDVDLSRRDYLVCVRLRVNPGKRSELYIDRFMGEVYSPWMDLRGRPVDAPAGSALPAERPLNMADVVAVVCATVRSPEMYLGEQPEIYLSQEHAREFLKLVLDKTQPAKARARSFRSHAEAIYVFVVDSKGWMAARYVLLPENRSKVHTRETLMRFLSTHATNRPPKHHTRASACFEPYVGLEWRFYKDAGAAAGTGKSP